jgi:hypothetical protein
VLETNISSCFHILHSAFRIPTSQFNSAPGHAVVISLFACIVALVKGFGTSVNAILVFLAHKPLALAFAAPGNVGVLIQAIDLAILQKVIAGVRAEGFIVIVVIAAGGCKGKYGDNQNQRKKGHPKCFHDLLLIG